MYLGIGNGLSIAWRRRAQHKQNSAKNSNRRRTPEGHSRGGQERSKAPRRSNGSVFFFGNVSICYRCSVLSIFHFSVSPSNDSYGQKHTNHAAEVRSSGKRFHSI
jgi:hypothetical protein